jgi:transcriptional regulator with XRE-family HTH domain
MNFGEKMKLLRKEKGWSQEELSKKIETDTRQVSLYENNKVAPSAETIVRISKVFNISIDYLLIDEMSRRPLSMNDESIFDNIQKMELLTEDEKKSVFNIIDGLASKNKLKNAVHDMI